MSRQRASQGRSDVRAVSRYSSTSKTHTGASPSVLEDARRGVEENYIPNENSTESVPVMTSFSMAIRVTHESVFLIVRTEQQRQA